MTIQWPAEARCGTCRRWTYATHGYGYCGLAAHPIAAGLNSDPVRIVVDVSICTDADHGCRAWEPRQ